MLSFLSRALSPVDAVELEIELSGNANATSVLVFTEHVNATYFISFDLPLRQLHRRGQANFGVASQGLMQTIPARRLKDVLNDWQSRFRPNAVFMSRYAGPHGLEIMNHFQAAGVRVIYHIDDDLLDVPEFLGAEIRKRQGNDETVRTRELLLRGADLVYASTERLASVLKRRLERQRVVHGAVYAPFLNEYLSDMPAPIPRGPVVGYMGSKGHQHDLELVVPAIERLLDERTDLRFEVFGTIKLPAALERFKGRVHAHSVKTTYLEFLSTLKALNWTIGLAPLINAPFNLCKAPTKLIEYAACGIPTIASNISVYTEAAPESAVRFVNGDWYSALTSLLDEPDQRQRMLREAQAHCANAFPMERLEQQLLSISSGGR